MVKIKADLFRGSPYLFLPFPHVEVLRLREFMGKPPIKYIFLIQLVAITEVVPSSGDY